MLAELAKRCPDDLHELVLLNLELVGQCHKARGLGSIDEDDLQGLYVLLELASKVVVLLQHLVEAVLEFTQRLVDPFAVTHNPLAVHYQLSCKVKGQRSAGSAFLGWTEGTHQL